MCLTEARMAACLALLRSPGSTARQAAAQGLQALCQSSSDRLSATQVQ